MTGATRPATGRRWHNGLTMSQGSWRARGFGALLAGALLTHELRYQLAGHAPHADGHGYMARWELVLGALVVGLALEFGWRLRQLPGRDRVVPVPVPSVGRLWLVFSALLLTLVGGQELLELLASPPDPSTGGVLAQLLGDGGWWLAPTAIAIGGACALVLRGAAVLAERLAGLRPVRRPRATLMEPPRRAPLGAPRDVVARNLAGRGPPLIGRATAL